MNRTAAACLILVVSASLLVSNSFSQDDYVEGMSVLMTASCSGDDVVLSIDFNIVEAPAAVYVGWVIEREVLGVCVDDALATDVMPWPEIGDTHIDLTITPDIAFYDMIYRVWAVDDEGNRTFIPWPQRHNYAHAECLPGPTTVGRFVDNAGWPWFLACANSCWPGISPWDSTYPEGASALVGTDVVMELYGTLYSGMHGTIINSTLMAPSSFPCDPVGTEDLSWGGLKAQYK